MKFVRNLQVADFVRVNYYAKRIRVLGTFYHGQKRHTETSVMPHSKLHHLVLPVIISRNPSKPLLPNLRLFNARPWSLEGRSWVARAAISDRLESINILLANLDEEHTPSLLNNMELTLKTVACTLKKFSFSVEPYQSLGSELTQFGQIKAAIPHFSCIEALGMFNVEISSAHLGHLVGLHTLLSLHATISARSLETFLEAKPIINCNLNDISLRTDSLVQCVNLLTHLGRVSLKSLRLVRRRDSADKWDLDEFFRSTLQHNFMQGLTSLQIQSTIRVSVPEQWGTDITRELVKELLSLRHIKILRLSVNSRVRLDLPTMEEIASGWPELEVLDLHERTTGAPPQITLFDAAKFVARCPRLRELHLRVDASNPNLGFAEVGGIPQSHHLHTLDICTSPAPAQNRRDGLSEFLVFTFPKLHSFSFGWQYYDDDMVHLPFTRSSTEKSHYDQWREVYQDLYDLLHHWPPLIDV